MKLINLTQATLAKLLLTISAVVSLAVVPTYADTLDPTKQYQLVPLEDNTFNCTTTELAIAAVGGVAIAAVVGVVTVAALPLTGPGVVAGSVLGYSGAFTAPFLVGTTLPAIGINTAVLATIFGSAAYYGICVGSSLTS